MSIHLRPTAPIAPDALLPGDPGRALSLAQELLDAPKMSNHHRGLWGYHGERTGGGGPLTIQSTGIGGPSAAVVMRELAALGTRRAIRIGTCTALDPELAPGSLAVVSSALAGDGTSRALGAGEIVEPARELTEALAAALAAPAIGVATGDLYYDPPSGIDGARARDLATAPLFALGRTLGVEVACVLAVAARGEERISDERLAEAELEMGRAAAAALASSKSSS